MELYRLTPTDYANLSGFGGLYCAGRWHSKGTPITYTASSRSLATLERFIHESMSDIPPLSMLTIWVPDDISIERVTANKLPTHWDLLPDNGSARLLGDQWLASHESLILQVPSAIVRDEFNYLINPQHQEFNGIKIVDQRDYFYDSRLQKMVR